MLTMGAPHSSTESRHSSTLSLSLMVCEYSRIRPQPVHVKLQACKGSSMRTSGKRFSPDSFLRAMYPAMDVVRLNGKRMGFSIRHGLAAIDGGQTQTKSRSVAGKGHEREVKAIHVILEVEHLGEAGAGKMLFLPGAVGLLGREEILDSQAHFVRLEFSCGEQRQEGPRALGGGRRPLPRQARVVITTARFAPAAAGLLHLFEPGDATPHHGLLHVVANTAQAQEHLPGAIDVVYSPAADPGSIPLLRGFEEAKSSVDLSMPHAIAVMAQGLERACGK